MNSETPAAKPVVIRISVDVPDPLSGLASVEHGEELPFEGWLELIGVIASLIGSAGDSSGEREPGSGR